MKQQENTCCVITKDKKSQGILSGILYGLIPHSFCIAFIIFSTVSAVAASTFLKRFLLIPNFFYFLVFVSFLLATASSAIYLKKCSCLCASGIRSKWKYITALYFSTIMVNLLMFFVVFPFLANAYQKKPVVQGESSSNLSLSVQIPCSGHATLIIDEIKKDSGVQSVEFNTPGIFKIKYDPNETSQEKIASAEIFKTYKATIN
ncbi:MAG TPA: hypothetical protein P5548_01945 [Candidatus Moranbacteria bacterium]|nr:hypothetical protein [Candidatus Moranbacteria bacterium]HRZ33637.1 hypothetical protein [Candidatus Moranbacteria bacterium]